MHQGMRGWSQETVAGAWKSGGGDQRVGANGGSWRNRDARRQEKPESSKLSRSQKKPFEVSEPISVSGEAEEIRGEREQARKSRIQPENHSQSLQFAGESMESVTKVEELEKGVTLFMFMYLFIYLF